MTIKNQIDHRADFAKQKAAGQIVDVTVGRHGRNRPRLAARLARAQQRSVQRPLAAKGQTLAEQLGLPVPGAVKRQVAEAAEPLADLTPPPTANVPETATPEVQIDPPMGEGELPPVAGMMAAPPSTPRLSPPIPGGPPASGRWPELPKVPAEPVEADRPEGEVVTEEEPGETPLV